MNPKRATIIYNPMSGRPARRAADVRRMIGLLAERGIDAGACATAGPEDANELAREARAEGADIIVSYGGDGTLNEVIQGMIGSEIALAVWPGGTSNVVARDLGVPFDVVQVADMIATGRTKRIALGLAKAGSGFRVPGSAQRGSGFRVPGSEQRGSGFRVPGSALAAQCARGEDPDPGTLNSEPGTLNPVPRTRNPEPGTRNPEPRTPNPEPGTLNPELRTLNSELRTLNPDPGTAGRYFVMMAGVGLDASVARGVNKKLKRGTGEFAYWVSGLKHLFAWRREPFTIDVDGRRYETAFALIGNGKGYGGGMMLTPGAKLEEPRFEVFVLPLLANNFAYLRALGGCLRGRPEAAGAVLVQGTHITANSAHEPWVEADGEVIGPLPMTFEIVPDALSVIVP